MQRLTVKNIVTESKANGAFSEPELTRNGIVEDHNIILTTNKECSFRCVMCDLWKNTLDYRVKDGAIAKQVKNALNSLPKAKHLKLYNAGSFFDRQSIPKPDTFEIADYIQEYETLIVEVHPKLIGKPCFEFADYLQPQLEVAMGLETVDELQQKRRNWYAARVLRYTAKHCGYHSIDIHFKCFINTVPCNANFLTTLSCDFKNITFKFVDRCICWKRPKR